jgi:hypothetical protein
MFCPQVNMRLHDCRKSLHGCPVEWYTLRVIIRIAIECRWHFIKTTHHLAKYNVLLDDAIVHIRPFLLASPVS